MERTSADLRQGVRNLAHRFELPAFWSWWTGELARALPGASRAAVQRRRMRPILAFAPGAAVLWVPRVASGKLELVEQAQVPLGGDPAAVAQAGHAAIEGLARKAYGGSVAATRLRVALPPSQVLRKTLVLPAAVEENLRQAIEWDLDRHTPFPAEQLHFDAVVVGRDAQNKTIRVDWAAALRSHVDQAVRQAQAWGATVVAVTPEMPGTNGAVDFPLSRLNLLPAEARTDAAPWRRWQLWLPVGLVLVAAAAAVAVPIWQKRERFIATAKETAEARAQAAAADALRAEFEKMTGDYNFALARKFGFPPTVQLIEDLSRLLPDDTWLLQFELKTPSRGKEPVREVVLRGESGSASRLVALLEESKLFEQASPRSPMTKIQPGPGEIFDLGAQLKPLPPPAMIELVALAPPEGAAPAAGTPAAPVTPPVVPAAAAPTTPPPDAARPVPDAKPADAAAVPAAGVPSGAPAAAHVAPPLPGPPPSAPAQPRAPKPSAPVPPPPAPPAAEAGAAVSEGADAGPVPATPPPAAAQPERPAATGGSVPAWRSGPQQQRRSFRTQPRGDGAGS
jgi:general secretion pathway protein L